MRFRNAFCFPNLVRSSGCVIYLHLLCTLRWLSSFFCAKCFERLALTWIGNGYWCLVTIFLCIVLSVSLILTFCRTHQTYGTAPQCMCSKLCVSLFSHGRKLHRCLRVVVAFEACVHEGLLAKETQGTMALVEAFLVMFLGGAPFLFNELNVVLCS